MSDQVDLPVADKYQSLLQVAGTTFGGCGQAHPMYPKQQVCKISIIFQERGEG